MRYLLLLSLLACGEGDGNVGADDAGANAEAGAVVDTTGACGVICRSNDLRCTVEGFDPDDGLNTCTANCQRAWPEEQSCAGLADALLECLRANARCEALEEETCRDSSSGLRPLLACAAPE